MLMATRQQRQTGVCRWPAVFVQPAHPCPPDSNPVRSCALLPRCHLPEPPPPAVADTPAALILGLIQGLVTGQRLPDLRHVLLIRTALLRGVDVYQPLVGPRVRVLAGALPIPCRGVSCHVGSVGAVRRSDQVLVDRCAALP